MTLDAILAKNNPFYPDLVKLDVQGFELQVLAGANSIFERTEMMILEVSNFEFITGQPIAREVIAFMGDRGYEIYDLCGFLRRPFDGALAQMDIAFVKANGFLRSCNKW